MRPVDGLHHVTCIAGPAQENLDFYAGVLGMRLVKKSVNQDDPGTYHLFYADAAGAPGSDLTFFPWAQMAPPRLGHGLAVEVALAVPAASLPFWASRLERYGAPVGSPESRFGDATLTLVDPHGLRLALVAEAPAARPGFTPWSGSPVPVEHQVRGLFGARVWEREPDRSAAFATGAMGMERRGEEHGWTRYAAAGGPGVLDVQERRDAPRGAWGIGSVHHLAWRVADEEHQLAVRAQVVAAGANATEVIDRFWFRSVYYKEPGGVLFELATDGPGFAVDEDPAHLGEALVLPPWLEPHRARIEEVLPPLTLPAA